MVTVNPFRGQPRYVDYPKERLVQLVLGSHEYLLTAIEAWAGDVVMRYGLDEMFTFQWDLWSEKVLPAVRDLKNRWMKVGDGTVEAFRKDIQMDASSFPGKAFEMTFEMPEPDVGILTFNKCISVEQWEALGRPDIAEKAAHVTCPASIIDTANDVQPQHEGGNPGHPAAHQQGGCLLPVAAVHAHTRTIPSTCSLGPIHSRTDSGRRLV